MVKVEPIGDPTSLGEGPHWDQYKQVLYFVDIPSGTVNKYDPTTKVQASVKVGGSHASLVVPVEGKSDQFVVAMGRGIALMTWDGKSSRPTRLDTLCIVHDDEGERENKLNDGKVDPTGRFWAGTMGHLTPTGARTKGSLFSFSEDWKPTTRLTDISLSNGMAWSCDLKTMYYIDSFASSVDALDFNAQTGELSNRRVVFDFKKNNFTSCAPDGMTIDTEGKLWVACMEGGQVIRVDPTSGQLLTTISIPSPLTTSVAFGGPNLDELYVTTGKGKMNDEELKKYPLAGHVFRITEVGAKGFPAKNVQLS